MDTDSNTPPAPPPHPRGGYNKHKLNWHINRNISEIMQVTKRMMPVNSSSLKDGSRVQEASGVPNIHFKQQVQLISGVWSRGFHRYLVWLSPLQPLSGCQSVYPCLSTGPVFTLFFFPSSPSSSSSIPSLRGSLGHYRWFCNQFSPFFPVLHCPLGLAELQAITLLSLPNWILKLFSSLSSPLSTKHWTFLSIWRWQSDV